MVKRHAADGAQMVATLGDDELTAIVRHHHERLDGSGYPDGLEGSAIPVGARIVAVADTFDAMTSSRPYRHARSHKDGAGHDVERSRVEARRGCRRGLPRLLLRQAHRGLGRLRHRRPAATAGVAARRRRGAGGQGHLRRGRGGPDRRLARDARAALGRTGPARATPHASASRGRRARERPPVAGGITRRTALRRPRWPDDSASASPAAARRGPGRRARGRQPGGLPLAGPDGGGDRAAGRWRRRRRATAAGGGSGGGCGRRRGPPRSRFRGCRRRAAGCS